MTGHQQHLTISQLASYAGVTVRAVRHYHERGLLPEPQRDASGYRRYDAQAVVDVIRVKTLSDAGVPLSRVRDLLAADPEEFAAGLAEVDRELRAEVRRLQAHRARVAQLESAERLALPDSVVTYLDRLRDLGASERGLRMERDMWLLLAARLPEQIDEIMVDKHRMLDDPAVLQLVFRLDEVQDWEPDDPRLVEVADGFAAHLETVDPAELEPDALGDRTLAAMMDEHVVEWAPAFARLLELMEERGWTGWTQIQRVDSDPVHGPG